MLEKKQTRDMKIRKINCKIIRFVKIKTFSCDEENFI